VSVFFRRLLIALLLGIIIYGAFVVVTGLGTIRGALSEFAWWTFLAAIGLSSLNYVIRFYKWEYYLGRLDVTGIPAWDSFLIFLSGFVLTVTPGKVGEVFKSAILQKTYGVDAAKTAPIIIAERLTDVIAIVFLVLVGSLGFSGGLVWAILGLSAVATALTLILWDAPMDRLLSAIRARGGRLGAALPRLETARESLKTVSNPKFLLIPAVLSVVGWGAEGVGLWLLLFGFGQDVSALLSMFFYSTATLAGALVPMPGGLGVAETIMQTQLVQIGGASSGAATGAMLLIRFATLWWAVVVGFIALALIRRKFPRLL
jgi:uncharacterized membrane protein YbhN (UPF0104 family)